MRLLSPFLLLLLLIGMAPDVQAQAPSHCGTDHLLEQYKQDHPEFRQESETAEAYYQQFLQSNRSTGGQVRVIPVVVHLIQSTSAPTISDARVFAQIEVLNEDFRKLNSDTINIPAVFQGVAVDSDIEFCLASIDPVGCPTTGINRVVSPANASHGINQEAQLKSLIQWPPTKYLNIWVPEDLTGGLLGYATFPTQLASSPGRDGVVINGENFGRGISTPQSPYNLGRTATHEVGHWLGLYHTFRNGCVGTTANNCNSQGDLVCDTPPTSASNGGCPGPQNTCTESPVDQIDQTMNYMDYVNDVCMNMFSAGQKTRMDAFLNSSRSVIWSASNLTDTGCDGTVSPGCTPQADFLSNVINVCSNSPIDFSDISTGIPTSWQWTFPGGTPGTATVANPTVSYSSPGIYAVTLEVSNGFGTDTEIKNGYIRVTSPILAPVIEGFEGILQYPQDWYGLDGGGDGTWDLTTAASSTGSNSMWIENFGGSASGAADDLVSLPFDLTGIANPKMSFDRAYRRYSSFVFDSLKIEFSPDCGLTWNTEWQATGFQLATVGGLGIASGFVPTASQWQSDTIDLAAYAQSSQVRVRFRSISGGGQNIFIDNINIDNLVSNDRPSPLDWSFSAVNPFSEMISIRYNMDVGSEISFRLMDLQGRTVAGADLDWQGPGTHRLDWKAESLQSLPAGAYLLQGSTPTGTINRKLLKLQ